MGNSDIIYIINTYKEVHDSKHTITDLSKCCYRSSMQLQRDFYNVTGYSANEYLRHVRLSNALCKIKTSDMSLADIAYSCGYSSQQALCREIKSILHTTAKEYRNSNAYYFISVFRDDIPFSTEVSNVIIPRVFLLQYYSPILREIENNAVTTFLQNNSEYSGRIFGRNGTQKDNMFCYELYVENYNSLNTDGFKKGSCFDAYDTVCAQIRVKNNEQDINSAWDYIYSEWLPKSMFEYAGANNNSYENCYFEEYFYKKGKPVRLKLYLPIIRKENCLKITLETHQSMRFIVSNKTGFNAEREASRTVIEYLSKNYPGILRNTNRFYYRHDGNICTCGVYINEYVNISKELQILDYDDLIFAVLHFNGISSFDYSSDMLMNWLDENNIQSTGEPFAIYDTSESYDCPDMKVYCPISKH